MITVEQNILEDVKTEIKKLIADSKKYPGSPYLIAYQNVLAMIEYAERGELKDLEVVNCLHRKLKPIYEEVQE